jgi:hypothetical protein
MFHVPGWGKVFYLRRFEESQPKTILEKRFWKLKPALTRHYWTTQIIGDRHGNGYGFGKSKLYGKAPELYKLGSRLLLKPNYCCIDLADGGSSWCELDSPMFRDRLQFALEGWRFCGGDGTRVEPQEIVKLFWRGPDGELYKVAENGQVVGVSAGPDAVEEAFSAFLPTAMYEVVTGGIKVA